MIYFQAFLCIGNIVLGVLNFTIGNRMIAVFNFVVAGVCAAAWGLLQ